MEENKEKRPLTEEEIIAKWWPVFDLIDKEITEEERIWRSKSPTTAVLL
jgi:hypothetical protein